MFTFNQYFFVTLTLSLVGVLKTITENTTCVIKQTIDLPSICSQQFKCSCSIECWLFPLLLVDTVQVDDESASSLTKQFFPSWVRSICGVVVRCSNSYQTTLTVTFPCTESFTNTSNFSMTFYNYKLICTMFYNTSLFLFLFWQIQWTY